MLRPKAKILLRKSPSCQAHVLPAAKRRDSVINAALFLRLWQDACHSTRLGPGSAKPDGQSGVCDAVQ